MFICNVALEIDMMDPYLAGVLFGDGTLFRGKNRAYAVWIDQKETNGRIIEKCIEKFEERKLNVHAYGFLDKKRALVYSKKLYLEFMELRKNPVKFFNAQNQKRKFQFISGFFDAEGTVTDRLVLYNSHIKLLKAIQRFFVNLGLNAYIYRYGKIHGIQVYRKRDVAFLKRRLNCVKLRSLCEVNKHSCALRRNPAYAQ